MTNHLKVTDLMAENARLRDLVANREDLCGQLVAKNERLRAALTAIAAIEDKYEGSDWQEIEEARKIANEALNHVGIPKQ